MRLKKLAIVSLLFSFMFAAFGCMEEKARVTKHDMKRLGKAVENYIIDHGTAPEVDTLKELAELLTPRYIEDFPLKDAWGRSFHYAGRNTARKDGQVFPRFWLASSGTESEFGGFLKYILGTGRQDGALVYSDGEFV